MTTAANPSGGAQRRCLHAIGELLRSSAPDSVLAIAPRHDATLTALQARFTHCDWQVVSVRNSVDGLDTARRFDFGVVLDTLEHLADPIGNALLARLRDVATRRFCLSIAEHRTAQAPGGAAAHDRLSALGLQLIGRYTGDAESLRLYFYDIATYKAVPDWLNSRNWANPDRWDKERW